MRGLLRAVEPSCYTAWEQRDSVSSTRSQIQGRATILRCLPWRPTALEATCTKAQGEREENTTIQMLLVTPLSAGKKTCYRCGSDGHLANSTTCPATSFICNKCKKVGHFAKACHATQTRNREVREVENPEIDIPEVIVLNTDHSALATGKITWRCGDPFRTLTVQQSEPTR